MRVLLDETPCCTEATSIGDALCRAAALAEEQGRLIVEVIVDGVPWDEEQIASEDSRSCDATEVRCVTCDTRSLVSTTLQDAANALAEADTLQRHAAELLQSDRQPEAMEKLAEALTIWQSVHDAVNLAGEAMQLDLERLGDQPETLPRLVEELRVQLDTLRSELETGDTVGLADALMYDLPDTVLAWREAIQSMCEVIQGSP